MTTEATPRLVRAGRSSATSAALPRADRGADRHAALVLEVAPYAAETPTSRSGTRESGRGVRAHYNPGERVMGFSTPVWTLWNALGYALTHDPVTWSRATTLGLECAALLVAASMLASRCGRATAWCFAVFYAAWPYFAAVAVSGMETGAMLAIIILTARSPSGAIHRGARDRDRRPDAPRRHPRGADAGLGRANGTVGRRDRVRRRTDRAVGLLRVAGAPERDRQGDPVRRTRPMARAALVGMDLPRSRSAPGPRPARAASCSRWPS